MQEVKTLTSQFGIPEGSQERDNLHELVSYWNLPFSLG